MKMIKKLTNLFYFILPSLKIDNYLEFLKFLKYERCDYVLIRPGIKKFKVSNDVIFEYFIKFCSKSGKGRRIICIEPRFKVRADKIDLNAKLLNTGKIYFYAEKRREEIERGIINIRTKLLKSSGEADYETIKEGVDKHFLAL